MSRHRHPINEISNMPGPPVHINPVEGPADITLVKAILTRDPVTKHLIEQRVLRVETFTRGSASIRFEYAGIKREVFFAGILEIVPVQNG